MRFQVGDVIRLKKGHFVRDRRPNDYKILRIEEGEPDYPRIKCENCDNWIFKASSLRLVRRQQ